MTIFQVDPHLNSVYIPYYSHYNFIPRFLEFIIPGQSVVSGYKLESLGSIPNSSLCHHVYANSKAHTASCPMDIRDSDSDSKTVKSLK
jgi:hypothetical protein